MCKNLFIGLIATCLLLVQGNLHAQTGLNFQGVARSSNNTILASQPISIRLSILQGSANGNVEYTEIRKLNTNAQGLFTAVIGDADAISSIGNFNTINWKNTPKFLKIDMDANAGNNFTTIGTTQFQYVAYAQFAKSVDAINITGIIPVEKGGTGVSSIASLKTVLAFDKSSIGLSNVENTTDTSKPISNATKAALDLKLDISDTLKYAKQKFIDSSLITKLNISDTAKMFKNRIGKDTLNLSARIDLKASITDLNLKAPLSSPKFTGTVAGITKSMVGLDSVDNTADIDKPISIATLALLNTKVSSETFSTSISIKESLANKSTSKDLGGLNPSDTLYPTQKAVKTYIDATNSSDGILDGGISTIKLADGAVTYSKFQNIPTNTILGNTSSSTASMQAITTTGSNNVVLSNSPTISSPTLITPDIGNATASTINSIQLLAPGSEQASLTVIGSATIKRANNGDDAPNQRYESLLTDGIVSLNTDQPISGKKTFFNDIQMGNIGGIGSITPTTINFANGSKLGDVQNINDGAPDNDGSIDLYAPDGAKWVQLNYGNSNYVSVGPDFAVIYVNGNEWKFDSYGFTTIPSHVFLGGSIFFSQDGITNNTDASIVNSGPLLQVKVRDITDQEKSQDLEDYGIDLNFADKSEIKMDDNSIESFVKYIDVTNDWESNLKINPSNLTYMFFNHSSREGYYWVFDGETLKTILPGDLILNDRKRIDFISGDPSVTNSYIYSDGPFLKIHSRVATSDEIAGDRENGISLEYNNNNVTANSSGVGMNVHNENTGSDTFVSLSESSFNFYSNDNTNNQNRWYFDGLDASTNFPGALFLNGNIETSGNLKLGNTLFPNTSGNPGDVLTIDAQTGNAIWRSPEGISSINGITSGTQSFTTGTDGTDFNITSSFGIHTFNFPDASTSNRGLLNSADYIRFNNKQDALTNPNSDLFWDASNKRLGIRNNNPAYPFEINQEEDNYGFMLNSPNSNRWGSTIGFQSNIGSGTNTNTGLFQLDRDGAMVFRTLQDHMYFDNEGPGNIFFRMGKTIYGMRLDNSYNLHVDGIVQSGGTTLTSDIRLKKNILPLNKALNVIQKLNPVSYQKKQTIESDNYSINENGFIAQELQKVLPMLVHESTDKEKLLSVNYTAIIPILTKGIQEQQAQIEELKKEMKVLKKLLLDLNKKK